MVSGVLIADKAHDADERVRKPWRAPAKPP
jgi:hypothetical protein